MLAVLAVLAVAVLLAIVLATDYNVDILFILLGARVCTFAHARACARVRVWALFGSLALLCIVALCLIIFVLLEFTVQSFGPASESIGGNLVISMSLRL